MTEQETKTSKEKPSLNSVGFALLSENAWEPEKILEGLKAQWALEPEAGSVEQTDTNLLFKLDGDQVILALMPAPIPNGEAELCAKNNYFWDKAESVAKAHVAHLLVVVMPHDEDRIRVAKLFTKVMAVVCAQPSVTGIFTTGVVFEPKFYAGFAEMMKEDLFPLFNQIWFGIYPTEDGWAGYTYGLENFGKKELEVLPVNAEPNELRDFLVSVTSYLIDADVTLKDGETIGFSPEDKHTITESQGVALPDLVTLKLSY